MSGVLAPPVLQSGTVTPRQLVVWTTDGVIQDAGTPSNPLVGGGLGFVSANDQSFTVYNAPKTGPGSYLSLGISPTAANLTVQNYNGGPQLPLNFVINGVTIPFPGPTGPFMSIGGGTFTGPVILNANPVATLEAATKQYVDAANAIPTPGFLFGLTMANDIGTPNTVLDVAAGSCSDSTNTVKIVLTAFSKGIGGSWVSGNGNNGMGVGLTATLNTWYHVFVVVVSGVSDVYFDTSATAANKPVGTTAFRRIGSFFVDASVHVLPFIQQGDRFDFKTPLVAFNGTPGVTTAQTLVVGAPLGVVTEAILTGDVADTSVVPFVYISALAQTDTPPGNNAITGLAASGAGALGSYYARVFTNTSSQIRFRMNAATTILIVNSQGYIDTRGK